MKTTVSMDITSRGRPSLFANLLERLARQLRHGAIVIETPNGERVEFDAGEDGTEPVYWTLHSWKPLYAIAARGALGLGESYMAGEWSTADLPALLYFASANERALGLAGRGIAVLQLGDRVRHWLHRNSPRRAARNIAHHYDLGNDFYAEWLDPSMTYSSALFADEDVSLEQAQQHKYQRLANLAGVEAGQRTLEIGCGWGGFMHYAAAQRDANLTGVTISGAQRDYAVKRLAAAGVSDRARVEFRDYRDIKGQYDSIVSIEMFEAVGEAYWDIYANKLKTLLARDGRAALQLITIDEDRFQHYRRSPDFIQRYIFPGGMLPSVGALRSCMSRAGLQVTDLLTFGQDYARTLSCWRERFDAAWPDIEGQGFDARFQRMWHFYLAYCEAGFRDNAVNVVQVQLAHQR